VIKTISLGSEHLLKAQMTIGLAITNGHRTTAILAQQLLKFCLYHLANQLLAPDFDKSVRGGYSVSTCKF